MAGSPGNAGRSGQRRSPLASVLVYTLLAFAVTWIVWVPRALATQEVIDGQAFIDLGAVWTYGPAIAAVLAAAWTGGRGGLRELASRLGRWRVGWEAYLLVLVIPVLWGLLTVAFARVAGADVDLVPPEAGVLGLVVAWIALSLTDGLGEEVGWRGWALPQLLERLRPLGASLLLGIVWAAWHLPLLATEGSYLEGSEAWVLFARLPATAIVFTWVYHRSRGSALVAVLLHGTMNVVAGLVAASPAVDAAGVAAHWVTALAVIRLAGRELGRPDEPVRPVEGEATTA